MSVTLRNIKLPLADFTLELEAELQGRVTAIFGPSGAGKTSLLELVAGLRRAESGFIQIGKSVLLDTTRGIDMPSRLRRVRRTLSKPGHPHLPQEGVEATRERITLEHVIEVLEIGNLLDRRIGSLSGGEQQRTAFARALLASPRLLLLDEPLASLDAALKGRILDYLRRIRDEFAIPMLYVTHDAEEVRALCDTVLQIERGQVVRDG
jgi:molybdate transport system ATP-binding protein